MEKCPRGKETYSDFATNFAVTGIMVMVMSVGVIEYNGLKTCFPPR
jgi:hypothetical protein